MRVRIRSLPKKADKAPDPQKPESSFPDIVAKPKKPVENKGMFRGKESLEGLEARRFGLVAQTCGEAPTEIPLSVADRFKLLRTPFDEKSTAELRYRNRVRNRQTAITAMCVVCTGSRKGVTECADVACPLWPFRLGVNPYRGMKK